MAKILIFFKNLLVHVKNLSTSVFNKNTLKLTVYVHFPYEIIRTNK